MNNLEKIIHLMQTDDSKDAPSDAIKWSKNLFKTRVSEPKAGVIDRVVAVLREELTPGTAAFGERSGSAGAGRQMLFEAGDVTIDLRITPGDSGFDLRGQLLGEGVENAGVVLGSVEESVNEFGAFRFVEVEAGTYELLLKLENKEIVVDAVIVG